MDIFIILLNNKIIFRGALILAKFPKWMNKIYKSSASICKRVKCIKQIKEGFAFITACCAHAVKKPCLEKHIICCRCNLMVIFNELHSSLSAKHANQPSVENSNLSKLSLKENGKQSKLRQLVIY